jgi:hypothetical protein
MKSSALIILAVILAGCGKPHEATVSRASIPTFTEQQVRAFVTPGRTIAEVTNRFGIPNVVSTNNGHMLTWFCNPFDTISKPATSPFGFYASFTNGTLETWQVLQVNMQATK